MSTCQYSSSESLSSSHEEIASASNTPNNKLNYLSPESSRHTVATPLSLSQSTNSNKSPNTPAKVLELSLERLSPELEPKLSPPTPHIKTNKQLITKPIRTTPTRDKEDILTLSSTQGIQLVQKHLSLLPSKPNVPLRPFIHKQPFRFATLDSEEVPTEVEQIISTAFREFINTDMIQVLRGILTFRNYRLRGENHNRILSPYIERSITLPLKIRDENFTLKLTPLSLFKNPKESPVVKRAALSQISCSPNQLAIRDRTQTVLSNRSHHESPSTKHFHINASSPLANGISPMYPIKLLDTLPVNSTPHSNRAISSQLSIGNTPTPKSLHSPAILRSTATHTTTTTTTTTATTTTHSVHHYNTNDRKIGLLNIKLLNTSAECAGVQKAHSSGVTSFRGRPLSSNHHNNQFSVRLLETTPTTNSVNRYDEQTRLRTTSNPVDQGLKLIPLDNSPLPNSTPIKRTFSKIFDTNLSKRVRLDTYNI